MRQSLLLLLLLLPAPGIAQAVVDQLLGAQDAPAGVVFEIIEDDEDDPEALLPEVMRLSRLLRKRFTDLPIAVVTHGREQFGLLASAADGPLSGIHADARELREEAVDVHVCGAHAAWYGHVPEDFPDYIDVAASGPARVRDHGSLGYAVVRLQLEE